MHSEAKTVEEYLESLPEDRRASISAVRETIVANLADGYEETMNWGMICYQVPLELHPETYNGRDDEDGCPDHGHIIVAPAPIEIRAQVRFETNRHRIVGGSLPILEEVAAVLRANPQLRLVRVHGHADRGERGRARLARRRAARVREHLLSRGIEAARLEAEGHGADQPLGQIENHRATAVREHQYVVHPRRW